MSSQSGLLLCRIQRAVLYSVEICMFVSLSCLVRQRYLPLLPFDGAWRLAADVVNDASDAWDFVDDPGGIVF